ncbi:type IV pilin, partial [Methanohalophilus sp.]
MSFKSNLCKDADGLAPVVGTILMVGIVVVLAAVIGTQALSVDTPDDHYERFREITEQNINSQTLPDGLVARWSFEGNYEDVTGNGNDGSAVDDVVFTDGISGQAIQLDGSSYVEVPSSESLNITDEITLVAYAKWTIDPA